MNRTVLDFPRKDIILEKLLDLDEQLEQYGARKKLNSPLCMILIDGAGLIVKYGLARATRDIDVLEPHQARLNGLTAIGHLCWLNRDFILSAKCF